MKKNINNKETEENMDRFTEQEAPEKNTDHAFVKVGRDGQPEIPGHENEIKEGEEENESTRNR
jgi:hypothetical protein